MEWRVLNWPGASPLGGRLAIDQVAGRVAEIVGVVGDVKPEHLDGEDCHFVSPSLSHWRTVLDHIRKAESGPMAA